MQKHNHLTLLIALLATLLLLGCGEDNEQTNNTTPQNNTPIQLQAHPWNATDSCWNPAQNAGTYTPTDAGCDTAHTLAKDTDGNLWLFPDSCIPDGYTLVDNQENIEAYSAEPCFN